MRLYLSSYGLGNHPEEIKPLLHGGVRTAVIMNAQDSRPQGDREARFNQEIDNLKSLGLKPVELDLRDYFGETEELAAELKNYDYIWVRGGNVFTLRRAYAQSGFDNLLIDLLKNDEIAYGGFSAGVCVLGLSLHGCEIVDPKDEIVEGYDGPLIWEGLGILDFAFAPHYKSDHPESEDISKYVEYLEENNVTYKTLRDGEAILINGDQKKFIGLSH